MPAAGLSTLGFMGTEDQAEGIITELPGAHYGDGPGASL